jgi:O-antigen/teichoic acid export membrane protein
MAENISIKRNVAASYAGSIYAVLISVVMAPVYLAYMGTEAYGLIGFFTMMNAWFQLLDMGLTPTVIRETALFRGGQISIGTLRVFLRGLEIIFGVVSITAAVVILVLTHTIATRWLKVGNLSVTDVQVSVAIMGAIVPIRWVGGLYRGVLVGFERMTWLAIFNCVLATMRFVGVLAVFFLIGVNVKYFFAYQFIVSLIDFFGVLLMSRYLMGGGQGKREVFSWKPLINNTAFSLTIGLVTTTSVLLSQVDKLVLSKELPLAACGIFSLAVAAASVINIAGTPMSQALLPRLTKLFAEGHRDALFQLYGNATQAMSVIIYPGIAALVFLSEPIMRAWTGHDDFARHAAPILSLYAIGNGLAAFNLFPYYIQYARGNLRLHFVGNAILLSLLIPAFVWGGVHYGGIGTGAAWAIANCLYFFFWVPIIHARFLDGRHWNWLLRDILAIVVPTTLSCWIFSLVVPWPHQRLAIVGYLAIAGVLLLLTSASCSSFARATLRRVIGRFANS